MSQDSLYIIGGIVIAVTVIVVVFFLTERNN